MGPGRNRVERAKTGDRTQTWHWSQEADDFNILMWTLFTFHSQQRHTPALHQHQAKLGPQNSSIAITQKLVRNANSQHPPPTYEISISRASAQQSQQALTSFLGDAHVCSCLRTFAAFNKLSSTLRGTDLTVTVCVCKVYTVLRKFITLGVTTMRRFGENEQVCVLIQITTLLQLSPTCPCVTLPQPLLLIFLYTVPPYTSTHSLVQ